MKNLVQKFLKKDKNLQSKENEVPLMISYRDFEMHLVAIEKEYQELRSVAQNDLEVQKLFGQEADVIRDIKLVWEDTAVNTASYHLRMMGYDINDKGSEIAVRLMKSGYNEVESASYIAMVTMALDINNVGDNRDLLISFVPHAQALLALLKKYKDENKMSQDVWKNDSTAIFKISYLDEHTESWIERILASDEAIKGLRLANSRVDYKKLGRS